MKIIVYIKQVADSEARILVRGDHTSLEIENKYAMNFFDEFAVEEALRIKEKDKESTVTAVSFGPPRAIEALRTAIAMGADKAVLMSSTHDDPLVIAKALSSFARDEGFDLILTGRQAIDDEMAAIGPMSAELLSIPHVSAITSLTIENGKARAIHEAEGGKETVEVLLPALLTTQKGLNEPRVPLITGVMRAMKAAIPTIDIDTGEAHNVLSYETPPKRPPVTIIEGESGEEKVKKLIRLLKEEARVL